jgi:PAS domain S-box-containing protein
LVLESLPDGFILLKSVRDANGTIADFRIEYTNPVAASGVNRRPEELQGQYLLQLFPDCQTSGIFDRYVTVAETGISTTFETFYDSEDVTGWFRNVVVKVEDGIAVTFTNITDRKQAELNLQQQEQHFKVALQTAKLGSWEHDLRTGILTCSAQCKANFGFPPEAEFTHGTLFQALHPDDRPLVEAAIQRSLTEHRDYEVEERCYHPDGSLHWLIVRGKLVYDAQGVPIRLVGVTFDITERKQFEESLRTANQEISNILESVTDAFVAFDRNWHYTYVNQEAARLLKRSPEELIGQRWQDVFPEVAQQHPVIVQQFERAMAEQETIRFEAFSLTAQCWLEVSLFPSPDGLAMYFRDISDRKRTEQRRDVQYAVARILAEATTVTEAAPAILQALCENLDWQVGLLWGVSLDGSLLHYIDGWQSPQVDVEAFVETNQQITFSQGFGLPGRTWASRQPLWITELSQDTNFARAALAAQVGLQTALAFPISLGDEVLGVIECFSDRIQSLDSDLLQVMSALGSQIGQLMERERTETALRERETELRLITNVVPVLIAFIDAEQRYRFNNQQYEEWFGKPATEINGKYLWEVLSPAVYETLRPYVEQVLAGHEVSFESRIPYKGEEIRDAIVNYVPRFDAQGNVEGFVALVNDITHRKQAEKNLQRYQILSEYSRDIVFYSRQDGHIVEANQAAVQAYGYDRAELLTLKIADLRAPDTLAALPQQFEQASQQGILFETVHRRKDGRPFPVEVSAQSAVIDGEKVVLSVIRDITERKHAEVERERLLVREQQARQTEQQARAEAERANRVKDEFLAVLSHELRSPLNPILGWTKLLQTGKLDEAKAQQALATIERNAKLQAELIEDLLDVSRILRGKLRLTVVPTNLSTIINAAIETVRLAAEAKGIDLQFIHPSTPDPLQVMGDPTRLQQVIWNLLSNAIKFTPAGGKVEVKLSSVIGHASLTEDTGQRTEPIQNSKINGMNPGACPGVHTIDYFRQEDGTTTRKFGGLGLGLAIVCYLTELHGGTVQVESPGEELGSTFTVLLPASTPEPGEHIKATQSPNSIATTPFSKLRILVVDDEADMRDLMVAILEPTGAEIKVTASAIAALDIFPTFQPDILISDIGMPEVDGYMLIRQLRKLPSGQGGHTPAIALTAYAGEINQQQALAAGFQQHLAKPVAPEALMQAIMRLIH